MASFTLHPCCSCGYPFCALRRPLHRLCPRVLRVLPGVVVTTVLKGRIWPPAALGPLYAFILKVVFRHRHGRIYGAPRNSLRYPVCLNGAFVVSRVGLFRLDNGHRYMHVKEGTKIAGLLHDIFVYDAYSPPRWF